MGRYATLTVVRAGVGAVVGAFVTCGAGDAGDMHAVTKIPIRMSADNTKRTCLTIITHVGNYIVCRSFKLIFFDISSSIHVFHQRRTGML